MTKGWHSVSVRLRVPATETTWIPRSPQCLLRPLHHFAASTSGQPMPVPHLPITATGTLPHYLTTSLPPLLPFCHHFADKLQLYCYQFLTRLLADCYQSSLLPWYGARRISSDFQRTRGIPLVSRDSRDRMKFFENRFRQMCNDLKGIQSNDVLTKKACNEISKWRNEYKVSSRNYFLFYLLPTKKLPMTKERFPCVVLLL